jgi:hypothetical protein
MGAILLHFVEWIVGLQHNSDKAEAIFTIALLFWCLFIGLGLVHTLNTDESNDYDGISTSSTS